MHRDNAASRPATDYWDEVGGEWTRSHPDALWRAFSDERNARLLERWLMPAPQSRILKTDVFDEAVSAGIFPALQERAGRVLGLDVSKVILEAARSRYPRFEVAAADVRHLPYRDSAFDAVVSISTLDHFESLDAVRTSLQEIHRVLRRGGGLLITMDNDTHPTVAVRNRLPFRLLHDLGVVPYRVGKTCGGRALRRMLVSSGFDVRTLTYVEHCPRLFAVRAARAFTRTNAGTRQVFMRVLHAFEALERWPTRALTGHYVAAWALKP